MGLFDVFEEAAEPVEMGQERRRCKRTPAVFRVTSAELPGQSATTVDLSTTGMLLQTRGAMEVGDRLVLEWADFSLRSRVCWCRDLDNDYMVGVNFEGVDEATSLRLEAFCAAAPGGA